MIFFEKKIYNLSDIDCLGKEFITIEDNNHMKKTINFKALTVLLNSFLETKSNISCMGGVGICVKQDNDIIYKKYAGMKNLDCKEWLTAKNGDTTLFRIASMTKPITAVAVLIQVSRGLLDLDEPIFKFIPEFKAEKSKALITPRMLLTHTSGVGAAGFFDNVYEQMSLSDKACLEAVVNYISKQQLAFEPNTRQCYSPLWAFDILARLVEITSGKNFETFLIENIFTPCGMENTTFLPTEKQWANMVYMHNRVKQNNIFQNTVGTTVNGCVFSDIPTTWHCGGAGLASTLPDYTKFAQMLLKDGIAENGNRILPHNYVEKMSAVISNVTANSEYSHWGLGVRVITSDNNHRPKGSFGWSGAYGTHFWVDPKNKITAVLMRNSLYDGGGSSSISAELEKHVYLSLNN